MDQSLVDVTALRGQTHIAARVPRISVELT